MKLGFIGMGNMASAILLGALKAGYLNPQEVWAYDVNREKLAQRAQETGIHAASSPVELVDAVDVVLLAVKPNTIEEVVTQTYDHLKGKGVISIALGWNHARYRQILPQDTRVVFIMPNTPCMVGEGMSLIEAGGDLTDDEMTFARGLFESIGSVETLKPELMGVGGTLSGCGPAFLYMVIEALADGAVVHGLPRDTAYRLASQMVLGSGKMQLQTGIHPGILKDNVCSPGGSTIRGVRALEDGGLRRAMIDAIDRAVNMK